MMCATACWVTIVSRTLFTVLLTKDAAMAFPCRVIFCSMYIHLSPAYEIRVWRSAFWEDLQRTVELDEDPLDRKYHVTLRAKRKKPVRTMKSTCPTSITVIIAAWFMMLASMYVIQTRKCSTVLVEGSTLFLKRASSRVVNNRIHRIPPKTDY